MPRPSSRTSSAARSPRRARESGWPRSRRSRGGFVRRGCDGSEAVTDESRCNMSASEEERLRTVMLDGTRIGAVLAIGGTDSSGGAGVTRDAEVLAECGVAGTFAVAAVTAQSNARVIAVQSVSPEVLREQIRAALETHDVAAVKIGMLGTRNVIEAVADALPSRDAVPIVLDPVLAASSGG